MLFNSLAFIGFLPVVTILYFLLPQKYRKFWLLLSSCFFYMYLVPYYILIVLCIILVDYYAGIFIEKSDNSKKKIFFYASITVNCSILFFFKYFNFFNENMVYLSNILSFDWQIKMIKLALPLGISFQTFQSMSYVIDVYKKKIKAEKKFFTYALFVMFYPQLVAGPIERAGDLLPQFYEKHIFKFKRLEEGLWLILWGLFQKVVVADRLAIIVDSVYNQPYQYSGLPLIIATVLFFVQIYCDFSGYSDIAVGCARILGFRITTNFNAPMMATTVGDFWSRWHITLMLWFRSYIFFPLTRKIGAQYAAFSLIIVFALNGLWHGARWTFVIFGLLNGLLIVIGSSIRKIKAIKKFKSKFITFSLVCFTAVFFRANYVHDAYYIISNLFSFKDMMSLKMFISSCELSQINFIIDIGLAFFIFIVQYVFFKKNSHYENIVYVPDKLPKWGKFVLYYSIVLMIIFLGVFHSKSFIYFQF